MEDYQQNNQTTCTQAKNHFQTIQGIKYLKKKGKPIQQGKYQGGYDLWQCTHTTLKYLQAQQIYLQRNIQLNHKHVLDLGCGHGILGMYAMLKGSIVTFHDYNSDVLQSLTTQNIIVNNLPLQNAKFISGQWQKIDGQFHYIFGSEIIYRKQYYKQIVGILERCLKIEGKSIIGNKMYYFGLSGDSFGFKKALSQSESLKIIKQQTIQPSVGCNKKLILEIMHI